MLRWIKLFTTVSLLTVLIVSLGFAQQPPERRSAPTAAESRARMMAEVQNRMLEMAQLTDSEKVAARQALAAKETARGKLEVSLNSLRRVAINANATPAEYTAAVNAYKAALATYQAKIAAEDKALMQKLSPGAQARSLSLGIVDNGFSGLSRLGPGPRPGMMDRMPGPPR